MKLFMDSSTQYLYLALLDTDVVDTYVRNGKNDHSETLTDALDNFLKKNNVTCDDIDSIFVGRGPGSYTGVRISGTVAKVLALVKNKKLYSFSTLDLISASHIHIDGTYLPRIVAKKKHSYYKLVNINQGVITFETTDLFSEDIVLENYTSYKMIEVNDELFDHPAILAKTIYDNKLYQEEDVFGYVPNYLRSEING